MNQGTIDAGERAGVDARYEPRSRRPLISKNDLLPLMALFGAIYGWVLLVVAAAAALIVLVS